MTPKCNETLPPAGTAKGPVQVRVWPETEESTLVTPAVDPGVYVKPTGNVSVIESSVTLDVFGFATVIV